MIIAIDGTSGSGKSTLARKLASSLNFGFFSAGALYRAITVKVLDLNISEDNDKALHNLIENISVRYTYDGEKNVMVVDGSDITELLHSEKVSNFVSKISQKPYIREFVRSLQRKTAEDNENIVMEGRDIGSVIFPDADLKIFVDCHIETRAKRRLGDYISMGEKVTLEKVIQDLKDRDYRDMHREISPLIICQNSLLIDTTLNSTTKCLNIIYHEMLDRELVTKDFFTSRGIVL